MGDEPPVPEALDREPVPECRDVGVIEPPRRRRGGETEARKGGRNNMKRQP